MATKNGNLKAYQLYANSDSNYRALDQSDRVGWYETLTEDSNNPSKNPEFENVETGSILGAAGEVGGWVGFQIGCKGRDSDERKASKRVSAVTRIEFVTEGLLLQRMKSQRDSTSYDCVIIDEAHERNRETDMLMALLRKMLQNKRCNLKVVVMSASIDQQQFSEYFGNCPVVRCDGITFPVEINYRALMENVSANLGESSTGNSSNNEIKSEIDKDDVISLNEYLELQNEQFTGENGSVEQAVDILFSEIHPREEGDVLIFLKGKKEIYSVVDHIKRRAEEEVDSRIHCGYVRKVVCCTNIAETSLTIPGVKFVIHVGFSKKIQYDHELRISSLVLVENSQASAMQRTGREGRVESGVCYRLYSLEDFQKRPKYDEPQLRHYPIDELVLYALHRLYFGSLEHLELMPDAQPSIETLKFSMQRLLNLEFIKQNQDLPREMVELTPDGRLAVKLLNDLSVEDIRMIIAAKDRGLVKQADQVAVLIRNFDDLQIRTVTEEMSQKFNFYLDELGDPFT